MYYLESESSVSCLRFSKELETYIDAVPEMELRAGEGFTRLFGNALVQLQPNGAAYKLTYQELAHSTIRTGIDD